jgi:predicted transcriptional regulator
MHYWPGKLDWLAAGLPTDGENSTRPRAGTVARHDVPMCSIEDRVGDLRSDGGVAVVVDAAGVVVGLLRAKQLASEPSTRVEDVMLIGPSTFRPYVPIREMADYMKEHDLDSSPITTSDGRLAGVLYRDDAVRAADGCPECARKMI